MGDATKTCVYCGEVVGRLATVCPHCRNALDYHAVAELPSDEVTRVRPPKNRRFVVAVAFGAATLGAAFGALIGVLAAGTWGAACGIILFGGFAGGIVAVLLEPKGDDSFAVDCPECGETIVHRVLENFASPGDAVPCRCRGCGTVTRVTVV
jgi:hypothetical protein